MPEHKALRGVEIKDQDKGVVVARFASYNEIDLHGDVTEKGAFKDGQEVLVSAYNHMSWGDNLPVGKGVIREGKDGAHAELQFFMNTTAGRETFDVVKEVGDLQEWSYGFTIEEESRGEFEEKQVRFLKRVDVHEISPVLKGAGKSTRTLALKEKERKTMADQLVDSVAVVNGMADRAEELVALRRSEEKKVSEFSVEMLVVLEKQVDRLHGIIEAATLLNQGPVENEDEDISALLAWSFSNLTDTEE